LYDSESDTWFNQSDAGSRVFTACMLVSQIHDLIKAMQALEYPLLV